MVSTKYLLTNSLQLSRSSGYAVLLQLKLDIEEVGAGTAIKILGKRHYSRRYFMEGLIN
jgi:hypothetical protein